MKLNGSNELLELYIQTHLFKLTCKTTTKMPSGFLTHHGNIFNLANRKLSLINFFFLTISAHLAVIRLIFRLKTHRTLWKFKWHQGGRMLWMCFATLNLKNKFAFLHIKPYNKDIYNHILCSTALLWQMVQHWELELIADVTASWKQQRSMCTQTISQKMQ